jgi:hypothetical protein
MIGSGRLLRVALVIGILIDAGVGLVSIFAQPLYPQLLDVPVKDSAMATILGGELLVAATVYVFPLRDPVRFRPLLWVCALDQTFGVVLPAYLMLTAAMPTSLTTIAPIPFQLVLVAVYVAAARRRLQRGDAPG